MLCMHSMNKRAAFHTTSSHRNAHRYANQKPCSLTATLRRFLLSIEFLILPHLRPTKIHLGMLFLEFPQHIHLLLLLARRLAHLLLPLVIHHFLHHAPRLAVQIAQLRVLGRDLRGVDFVGRVADDCIPPFHFVAFVQVDVDFFARGHGF